MKKLFNKIRLKLLFDGKLKKYLQYALGEIILVVVGILIALQINNWNEENSNRKSEHVYLKEMLEDYKNNLEKSEATIDLINEIVPELITLLNQSRLKKPVISADSLSYNFSSILLMPTYSSTDRVYQNLIGSGDFKLITSRKIKNEIANYYKAVDLIKLVQRTHELELVNLIQPYVLKNMEYQSVALYHFEKWEIDDEDDMNSILQILHEKEFRNMVMLKISILSDLLSQNENILKINKEIISLLKKEIDL